MRRAWVESSQRGIPPGRSLAAIIVVGGVLGGLIVLAGEAAREAERRDAQTPPPSAVRSPEVIPRQNHPGWLVETRDEILGRLIASPRDTEAMDALVRLQRFLGANDPEALRRAAAGYARAASARAQTDEHLTPQAMQLLMLANLIAATQIETERGGAGLAARSATTALVPAGSQGVRTTLAGPAERRATVADLRPGFFVVVSARLSLGAAQAEVERLASFGFSPLIRRTTDGLAQVQLGAFVSEANAGAQADRARRHGLAVSVMRGPPEGTIEPTRPEVPPAASPRPLSPGPTVTDLMDSGLRLYAAGWYGPALARFRQAAHLAPESARAHLWWGRAAFKASRPREARTALLRALDLAGDAEAGRQARLLLHRLQAGGPVGSVSSGD